MKYDEVGMDIVPLGYSLIIELAHSRVRSIGGKQKNNGLISFFLFCRFIRSSLF